MLLEQFTPLDNSIKLARLKLKNLSSTKRKAVGRRPMSNGCSDRRGRNPHLTCSPKSTAVTGAHVHPQSVECPLWRAGGVCRSSAGEQTPVKRETEENFWAATARSPLHCAMCPGYRELSNTTGGRIRSVQCALQDADRNSSRRRRKVGCCSCSATPPRADGADARSCAIGQIDFDKALWGEEATTGTTCSVRCRLKRPTGRWTSCSMAGCFTKRSPAGYGRGAGSTRLAAPSGFAISSRTASRSCGQGPISRARSASCRGAAVPRGGRAALVAAADRTGNPHAGFPMMPYGSAIARHAISPRRATARC